jgi:hypothetical protein
MVFGLFDALDGGATEIQKSDETQEWIDDCNFRKVEISRQSVNICLHNYHHMFHVIQVIG